MNDGRDNEEALIGSVLRDGTIYERAREVVKADMFINWNYSQCWQSFENLFSNGLGIDTITAGDELERMGVALQQGQWSARSVLSRARENGDPRNVATYAANVQDMFNKRFLDGFLTKAVIWAKNGRRAHEIIKDIYTELEKVSISSSQDEYTVPVSTAMAEAYEMTIQASKGEMAGVKTGLTDLDNILGSLFPGNVYLAAGRTGQGKTALLLTISLHAAKQGKKVALFSLEMSRAQVAQRLAAIDQSIDVHNLMTGKLTDVEWAKLAHGVEIISELPIIINDLSEINISQVRQTARKIAPDIVILDYIQLAHGDKKKAQERRELEVSEVSQGLKYMARELNIPVLAAAQLSRAVEQRKDNKPILSDLRESGSLEQDAYAVIFLWKQNELDKIVEAVIAKHRNGSTGSVSLCFNAQYTRFDNATFTTFKPNDRNYPNED